MALDLSPVYIHVLYSWRSFTWVLVQRNNRTHSKFIDIQKNTLSVFLYLSLGFPWVTQPLSPRHLSSHKKVPVWLLECNGPHVVSSVNQCSFCPPLPLIRRVSHNRQVPVLSLPPCHVPEVLGSFPHPQEIRHKADHDQGNGKLFKKRKMSNIISHWLTDKRQSVYRVKWSGHLHDMTYLKENINFLS